MGQSSNTYPNQSPYFAGLQKMLSEAALPGLISGRAGIRTPSTQPTYNSNLNFGGVHAGAPAGPVGSSPSSMGTGTTGTPGAGGQDPVSILMQMLSGGAQSSPGGVNTGTNIGSGVGGGSAIPRTAVPSTGAAGTTLQTSPGNPTTAGWNDMSNWMNQMFTSGNQLPAAPTTQSLDQILQGVTGENSAFTKQILPALNAQFQQADALTAASAKEGAGTLTGSGFANTLGTALNRNTASEQGILSNTLMGLAGQESTRQQAGATMQNTDWLSQFNAANQQSSQNASQFAQLLQMLFSGGQSSTTTSAGGSAAIPGLMALIAKFLPAALG